MWALTRFIGGLVSAGMELHSSECWYDATVCFQEKTSVDSTPMFLAAVKQYYTEPRPSSAKGPRSWEESGLGHLT